MPEAPALTGMPPETKASAVGDQLDRVRKDLLDFGLRNPLLNFRQPRGKGLEVTHPNPGNVFHVLVKDERSFKFRATDFTPAVRDSHARTEDLELQTLLLREPLEARLLATFYAARTTLEEQGVNTLFLAFGMLRWQDEPGDKFCRAPLILLPVELERTDARQRFTLKFNGDDIGENISLIEKLKLEHHLKLPRLPADEDGEDIDIHAYFAEVRSAVQSQPDWTVEDDAIVLSFFSFAKFLMYRDLDPETWTDGESLLHHPILNSLMGESPFSVQSPQVNEESQLDDALKGREPVLVDNADSSQTLAIVEALAGRNLVIQGPPGTGKSQTIVNLIAAAVHEGKKVLFVSEKMAALEVVKRRLDRLHLGASCLELHSNKTKKRELIEELRRTVKMVGVDPPQAGPEMALLGDHRDRLNAYCNAVNEPFGEGRETPLSIYGKLLSAMEQLAGVDLPLVRLTQSSRWTGADVARNRALAERLRDTLQQCEPLHSHPFYGSGKRTYMPTEREVAARALKIVSDALASLEPAGAALADSFRVSPPQTLAQIAVLAGTAVLLAKAPDFRNIDLHQGAWLQRWLQRGPDIRAIAESGIQMNSARARFDSILLAAAWDTDVTAPRDVLAGLGKKWWRWLSSQWRNAKRQFASLCAATPPANDEEAMAVLDAILYDRRTRQMLAENSVWVADLLGSSWRGTKTDFALLRTQLEWILDADQIVRNGHASKWCFSAVTEPIDRPVLQSLIARLDDATRRTQAAVADWRKLAEFNPDSPASKALDTRTIQDQSGHYVHLASTLDKFQSLIAYNQASRECRSSGLAELLDAVETSSRPAQAIPPLFEKARLMPLIEAAFQERPALAEFEGLRQNQTVAAFRRQDESQLTYFRAVIAARHYAALPGLSAAGQTGVLAKEFERKARFLPIRKLMEKAGNAVQAIKPVFMMSPLSIANYLPPGKLIFDLAIFDEASQVKPADSLGAIVRSKQVVVVGDSKQLPPTSFFDSIIADPTTEDEEEAATDDIESILGLFTSRGAPQKMLRWHYRSRHESLIAVSNSLFYDHRLIVFPSPVQDRGQLGLRFRHLPSAFYDRGGKRNNITEAKTVAAAVMDHARKQLALPAADRETLGVVAFSMAQMDAIRDELEILRKNNPALEEFFTSQHHEPFFVKNLENVQGDERDCILISIGYARTKEGYLAMNFGPLNRPGGERRLNVLISRARKRCDVFSNLTADDIDLARAPSEGVRALKIFLQYAQTGRMDISAPTGRAADSEFEEQVARTLARNGYQVQPQVGCSGFFLDLAVVDPANPGRYLLGIECDGAAYHRARSARDRDRLRQTVLEGLGWTIYRIWSTDWFRNPEEQAKRLFAAIEKARTQAPRPAPHPAEEPDAVAASTGPASEPLKLEALSAEPYQLAELHLRLGSVELHAVPCERLADWLVSIVNVESPVHVSEASRRIAAAAGVQRVGSRIQQAIAAACDLAASQRRLHRTGDFLWDLSLKRSIVRDRSGSPVGLRNIDLIAPEEIAGAILAVTESSLGMELDDLPAEVAKLLGFSRTSEETRTAVATEAKRLIDSGKLARRGNSAVVPKTENLPFSYPR
jgi:very-short-patch-repair endonuclease